MPGFGWSGADGAQGWIVAGVGGVVGRVFTMRNEGLAVYWRAFQIGDRYFVMQKCRCKSLISLIRIFLMFYVLYKT